MAEETIKTYESFIWSVADLLRGDYKQSEYGRVILPLTVIRRLDCVLEPTKEAVLKAHKSLEHRGIENVEPVLQAAAGGLQFYNTSPLTFTRLLDDPNNIADSLSLYISGFSEAARDVIEKFDFLVHIQRLRRSNLLYQVLSRLNRMHPLKENTFVLDFRNETETIVDAFEECHGCTVAPPTDPNILWDTHRRLEDFGVLRPEEITAAIPVLLAGDSERKRSGEAYAALAPGKERFEALPDERRLEFRDALTRFVRTYSFVSLIAGFTDVSLERDYIYCRALAAYLRDQGAVERLDLGSEVELTHLRHQITFSGALPLTSETGEVRSFFGEGAGRQQELELERLSSIIEVLNDRFGTDLKEADRLFFEQIEETCIEDEDLSNQARNNTLENFRLVFDRKFLQTVITRVDANEEIYKKILDDEDFRLAVSEFYLQKVYERLREGQ